MKSHNTPPTKGLVAVAHHRLVRFFRFCFGSGFMLGGDPARQFHWWQRFLQCVNGGESMPTVEYLEAVQRAKENQRSWNLLFFFNEGFGGFIPKYRVCWNHRTYTSWRQLVVVKELHLMQHLLRWAFEHRKTELDAGFLPFKIADYREGAMKKVTLPILVAGICDLIIRPARLADAMSNPKVKYFFRHVWKHRLSSVDVGHGVVSNSLANVRVMATPLAGASVDRGVEVEITNKHREQRG